MISTFHRFYTWTEYLEEYREGGENEHKPQKKQQQEAEKPHASVSPATARLGETRLWGSVSPRRKKNANVAAVKDQCACKAFYRLQVHNDT